MLTTNKHIEDKQAGLLQACRGAELLVAVKNFFQNLLRSSEV